MVAESGFKYDTLCAMHRLDPSPSSPFIRDAFPKIGNFLRAYLRTRQKSFEMRAIYDDEHLFER